MLSGLALPILSSAPANPVPAASMPKRKPASLSEMGIIRDFLAGEKRNSPAYAPILPQSRPAFLPLKQRPKLAARLL